MADTTTGIPSILNDLLENGINTLKTVDFSSAQKVASDIVDNITNNTTEYINDIKMNITGNTALGTFFSETGETMYSWANEIFQINKYDEESNSSKDDLNSEIQPESGDSWYDRFMTVFSSTTNLVDQMGDIFSNLFESGLSTDLLGGTQFGTALINAGETIVKSLSTYNNRC